MKTYPLEPRKYVADTRRFVYAVCETVVEKHHTGLLERLVEVAAIKDNGADKPMVNRLDHRSFKDPKEFWAWATRGRSVVVVFGCADRDLALLGLPEDWEPQSWTLHDLSTMPNLFHMKLKRKQRTLQINQVGNWHPLGKWAYQLNVKQVFGFMHAYRLMLVEANLGRLEITIGKQAVTSYQRQLHIIGEEGLRYHMNHDLHRFEWEAQQEQTPVRVCIDGEYKKLYTLDFTAFYLSIMQLHPLPAQVQGYWPEGMPFKALELWIQRGYLAIARIRSMTGQQRIWTSVDMPFDGEVLECALYKPDGGTLSSWATKMFNLRKNCHRYNFRYPQFNYRGEEAVAALETVAKALGVSMWGKLGRRNRRFYEADNYIYQPGDEDLVPYARQMRENCDVFYTLEDGKLKRYWNDPGAWQARNFHALAAFILDYGRTTMQQAMTGLNVVYAHTDSIWSLTPVKDTQRLPRGMGGVKQGVRHDVTIRNGGYIARGDEALPGVPKPGLHSYYPYTASLKPPGKAWFVQT